MNDLFKLKKIGFKSHMNVLENKMPPNGHKV